MEKSFCQAVDFIQDVRMHRSVAESRNRFLGNLEWKQIILRHAGLWKTGRKDECGNI